MMKQWVERFKEVVGRGRPRRAWTQHALEAPAGWPPTLFPSGGERLSGGAAAHALSRAYLNQSDRGGGALLRNIVHVLGAFTVGQGVKPAPRHDGAERELRFIQAFMEGAGLTSQTARDWVVESLIEGKFLVRLSPHGESGRVECRFVSWTQHGYVVETDEDDYTAHRGVTYRLNRTGPTVRLAPEAFVFQSFGGRLSHVNDGTPPLAAVLPNIENLDRALRDWREINHLFAAPTPVIQVETAQQAREAQRFVEEENWKIGHFLALAGGQFSLVTLPAGAAASVEREIITNAKVIAGATGVPVHFLGFPDLLSNRSTAENLFEALHAATSGHRQLWTGVYERLFERTLHLANVHFNSGFDPRAVGARLVDASSMKLRELKDVWLPLYRAGAISLETVLGKIPDVDVEREQARLALAPGAPAAANGGDGP